MSACKVVQNGPEFHTVVADREGEAAEGECRAGAAVMEAVGSGAIGARCKAEAAAMVEVAAAGGLRLR